MDVDLLTGACCTGAATVAGLESFFIEKAVFESRSALERERTDMAESGDSYRWQWRHDASLEGGFVPLSRRQL